MLKTDDQGQEIGENVTITDRVQLLSINHGQEKKIKCLTIENQLIDDEVSLHSNVFCVDIEELYFINCSFMGDGKGILREVPGVSKVGLINCNLSYDVLKRLLNSNNPYNNIDVLDLTGNELSKDPWRFVEVLRETIVTVKTIGKLILVDNGFDKKIISMIRYAAGHSIERIIL